MDLALILIFTKLFGEFFERIGMPELLGAILAGFVFGPVLGIVDITNIEGFGQIGLILLLFVAGFSEVDVEQMLKDKKAGILIGVFDSILPLAVGFYFSSYFGLPFTTSLFIGVALAATSISISLGAFIEKGKLNTRVGRSILGASVVDDIIGLLLLAIVVSIGKRGTLPSISDIGEIVFGIGLFAVIFLVAAVVFPVLVKYSRKFEADEAQFSTVIVLVILLAFLAEKLGLSTVLGAFLGGLLLSKVSQLATKSFLEKLHVVSEGIFIPMFFAWVGLKIVLDPQAISFFTLGLIILAILSKFIAAYISGKINRFNNDECLALGVGMIPRGEVALVVLILGMQLGVIPDYVFSSFMLLIFISVFLTPLLLSPILKRRLPR